MTPLEKVKQCQAELDKRKSERARAEGEHDALLKRLKDEFGLDSLEAAEAKATEMQAELETKKAEQTKLMEELNGMMEELK